MLHGLVPLDCFFNVSLDEKLLIYRSHPSDNIYNVEGGSQGDESLHTWSAVPDQVAGEIICPEAGSYQVKRSIGVSLLYEFEGCLELTEIDGSERDGTGHLVAYASAVQAYAPIAILTGLLHQYFYVVHLTASS